MNAIIIYYILRWLKRGKRHQYDNIEDLVMNASISD
jgi:hypothetical protein